MNKSLLFTHILLGIVTGESVNDLTGTTPVPDYMDQAASVGLAQPTSAWNAAKVTSPEIDLPSATPPFLNILNHGTEGDLQGAVPRENMVFLGLGRHGVGRGSECCGGKDCGGCNSCEDERRVHPPHPQHPHGQHPTFHPLHGECDHPVPPFEKPYLKVTPSINVQTVTLTHVHTATQTSYDVYTHYVTRTVTDEVHSTRTHVLYPERTSTYVNRHTVYEYPAATIDASHIRGIPTPIFHGPNCHEPLPDCD